MIILVSIILKHITPPGRRGHAMDVRTVDAQSRETLYLSQTVHKLGPLFYYWTYYRGPLFATVFPLQALENEYFSVARAACKCVSYSERGDCTSSLTIDTGSVNGGTGRRVRLCGKLSELDVNETLESITKSHASRSEWRCSGREMPKQLRVRRWASFAML